MTFTDELRARNLPVLRWTAIVFNPVYLLWGFIDHALVPHHATTFLVLRSICVAIASGIVLSAHLRPMKNRSLELFALFLIVYGCFLVPMLPLSGASFLDYALGFTLVLIGAGSIPSWAPSWSIGVIVALIAAAAPALIRSDIPAGHYMIGAKMKKGGNAKQEIEVKSGEETKVELTLSAAKPDKPVSAK